MNHVQTRRCTKKKLDSDDGVTSASTIVCLYKLLCGCRSVRSLFEEIVRVFIATCLFKRERGGSLTWRFRNSIGLFGMI